MLSKRTTPPFVFSSPRKQLAWQSFHIDICQSSPSPPLCFPDLSTSRCYFRWLPAVTSLRIAWALDRRGIPVLGAHKGYTATHQVIADVRQFGGGHEVARRLAQANIITNKNLIPADKPEDWDHPSGLRIGTTEVTRLGMHEAEMENIADFIACILIEQSAPEDVVDDVIAFREPYQMLYYCLDHGMPGKAS